MASVKTKAIHFPDDPNQIANGGVLLTFGDYKGSAIAMMIELLAAGLVGDLFSFEAKEEDNSER